MADECPHDWQPVLRSWEPEPLVRAFLTDHYRCTRCGQTRDVKELPGRRSRMLRWSAAPEPEAGGFDRAEPPS
jgi:hypothetical protein